MQIKKASHSQGVCHASPSHHCSRCVHHLYPPPPLLLSLSIPVGGDMPVSTHSTLWANAHSDGKWVLGPHHPLHLLPAISHCRSTQLSLFLPPHKQFLMRLGHAAIIVVMGWKHPDPPYEQWLIGLEAGAGLFIPIMGPLFPSIHPWRRAGVMVGRFSAELHLGILFQQG